MLASRIKNQETPKSFAARAPPRSRWGAYDAPPDSRLGRRRTPFRDPHSRRRSSFPSRRRSALPHCKYRSVLSQTYLIRICNLLSNTDRGYWKHVGLIDNHGFTVVLCRTTRLLRRLHVNLLYETVEVM